MADLFPFTSAIVSAFREKCSNFNNLTVAVKNVSAYIIWTLLQDPFVESLIF